MTKYSDELFIFPHRENLYTFTIGPTIENEYIISGPHFILKFTLMFKGKIKCDFQN